MDVDIAVDATVEAAVSEAIEEGLISAEEAADATASLSLVADNAQFFNFDILDAIASIVESGEFTMAEVRSTEGFNSLSEAGKTVVGQESFDYIAAHDSKVTVIIQQRKRSGTACLPTIRLWLKTR